MHGEHEQRQAGMLGLHQLDQLDAVRPGQRDIEQRDIRLERAHGFEGGGRGETLRHRPTRSGSALIRDMMPWRKTDGHPRSTPVFWFPPGFLATWRHSWFKGKLAGYGGSGFRAEYVMARSADMAWARYCKIFAAVPEGWEVSSPSREPSLTIRMQMGATAGEADGDFFAPGLESLGYSFLGDAVGIERHRRIVYQHGLITAELRLARNVPRDSRDPAARPSVRRSQLDRMQATRDAPGLGDGVVDEPGKVVQLRGVARGIAVQSPGQSLRGKGRAEQMLAQMVVQILTNAPLLALSRLEQRPLEEFCLRIVEHEKNPALGFATAAKWRSPRSWPRGAPPAFTRNAASPLPACRAIARTAAPSQQEIADTGRPSISAPFHPNAASARRSSNSESGPRRPSAHRPAPEDSKSDRSASAGGFGHFGGTGGHVRKNVRNSPASEQRFSYACRQRT